MKNVSFHFPNAQVKVSKVADDTVEGWTNAVRAGSVFTVIGDYGKTYTINASLMTYMEVSEYTPF